MTGMLLIAAMREAGMVARQASTIRDRTRVVEVVVTEEGLVVRGTYRDARHAFSHSVDVSWRELDAAPHLASNAVRLVVRALEEKGEDLGVQPVRSGQ